MLSGPTQQPREGGGGDFNGVRHAFHIPIRHPACPELRHDSRVPRSSPCFRPQEHLFLGRGFQAHIPTAGEVRAPKTRATNFSSPELITYRPKVTRFRLKCHIRCEGSQSLVMMQVRRISQMSTPAMIFDECCGTPRIGRRPFPSGDVEPGHRRSVALTPRPNPTVASH